MQLLTELRVGVVILVAIGAAPSAGAQDSRIWTPGSWAVVARLEDQDGSRLGNPQLMIKCDKKLVVLDLAENRLVAFNLELKPAWQFGRTGSGPREFRSPGDLSCDSRGYTWVLDDANSRVVSVSPNGALERSVVVDRRSRRLAVAQDGRHLAIVTWQLSDLFATVDLEGHQVRAVQMPAALTGITQLNREQYLAAIPDGGVVSGFRWSSTIVRTDSAGRIVYQREGVETIGFPRERALPTGGRGAATIVRIDPAATEAVQQIVVTGTSVYAVFGGASALKGRIVDRYDLTDGRYRGSMLLPTVPRAIAINGADLYMLVSEPIPAIIRLRWSARLD